MHQWLASVTHKTERAGHKLYHFLKYGEQPQEVGVLVVKALAKHQAANHVGHSAAQQE